MCLFAEKRWRMFASNCVRRENQLRARVQVSTVREEKRSSDAKVSLNCSGSAMCDARESRSRTSF